MSDLEYELVELKPITWKFIPGYEGIYEISEFGTIRVVEVSRAVSPRIMKPQLSKFGYLRIGLSDRDGKRKYYPVHRLVAITFIGESNGLPQINHKDGVKQNNHFSNLEWCTAQYNSVHAVRNGLRVAARGDRCGRSKLTLKEVREVKDSSLMGIELAEKFGVNKATISLIRTGKNWSHVI